MFIFAVKKGEGKRKPKEVLTGALRESILNASGTSWSSVSVSSVATASTPLKVSHGAGWHTLWTHRTVICNKASIYIKHNTAIYLDA